MTSSDGDNADYDHIIDVVVRRDVEDYAHGCPRDPDTARLVEKALLEDDAAREIVRAELRTRADDGENLHSQGLLFEPLQDLGTAVRTCRALADTYGHLKAETEQPTVCDFLKGRMAAFREAERNLAAPLREPPADVPDAWPEEAALIAPETRDSLIEELRDEPPGATQRLAGLHRSLLHDLRTLLHSPWPLRIKLLIADTYALLTEELESSAWRLNRRLSKREYLSGHGSGRG